MYFINPIFLLIHIIQNLEKKQAEAVDSSAEALFRNFYKLELKQYPLIIQEDLRKYTSLYLMEIIEITIFFKSGKNKTANLILFPKEINVFTLDCELDDDIIGVFINTNDKNYLRQIFDEKLFSEYKSSIEKNNIKQILISLRDQPLIKLVFLRDLFFSLFKNEIKELNSNLFLGICLFMLEKEDNLFIKNEILKKFIFTIINYCQYYTTEIKEDYPFYKTLKIDHDIVYKETAFETLYKQFFTTPQLKKNILNYLIDLLYHYYDIKTLDSNLNPRDYIKQFIDLIQLENNKNKQIKEKFKSFEFFKNITYLDLVKINSSLNIFFISRKICK